MRLVVVTMFLVLACAQEVSSKEVILRPAQIKTEIYYPAKDETSLTFIVKLKNDQKEALCVSRADFPYATQFAPLFNIINESGDSLKYVGAMADRSGPQIDYAIIPPHHEIETRIFVAKDYEFKSGKNKYFVNYSIFAYKCSLFNRGYVQIWDGNPEVKMSKGDYIKYSAVMVEFEY